MSDRARCSHGYTSTGEREANVHECPGWCTSGVLDLTERARGSSHDRGRASDRAHSSHGCTHASAQVGHDVIGWIAHGLLA